MKKSVSLPAIFFTVGLAMAAWFGGNVVFSAQPLSASEFFQSGLLGRSVPAFDHALVAAFLLCGVLFASMRKSVLQIPAASITSLLFLFWLWLALSLVESRFKNDTLLELARYTTYTLTLFGSVIILGREKLSKAALIAILCGATLVALSGVYEFMMSIRTANWRIFAGWQNPNAVAGLFAIAIPIGIGLSTVARQSERLLYVLGTSLCLVALWLTASKGGLLAATVGIASFILVAGVQRLITVKQLAPFGSALAVAAVITAGMTLLSHSVGGQSTAGGRLAGSSQESQQSFGFRKQLWQDTIKMVEARPMLGFGLGSYGNEIHNFTETGGSVVAHESYLQMAAEVGIPALILFLAMGVIWLFKVLKRHPGVPEEMSILRLGVVASVIAAGADILVESNMSYFGFSVLLFGLLGIGLNLSADGVMPERAPLMSRILAIGATSVASLYVLVGYAAAHYQTSTGMYALENGLADEGIGKMQNALAIAPLWSQPYVELSSVYAARKEPQKAIASANKAVALEPVSKNLILLAHAYEAANQMEEAQNSYRAAIDESENTESRREYFEFLVREKRFSAAEVAAKELIDTDTKESQTASALPWIVGTDAVNARIFLANQSEKRDDGTTAIRMLEAALETLTDYENKTYPELMHMTGLSEVESDRLALRDELGRDPTEEEVAEKWGMSLTDFRQFIEDTKRFEIAGQSVEEAERLMGLKQRIAKHLAELRAKKLG
jgi:O-antigen ligase/tetratricopeptide (TPR) repeat protein